MADRARLLSVSTSQAASWLSVTPSLALGLHLEPNELHASIRWWLGLDTSGGSSVSCLLSESPGPTWAPRYHMHSWR